MGHGWTAGGTAFVEGHSLWGFGAWNQSTERIETQLHPTGGREGNDGDAPLLLVLSHFDTISSIVAAVVVCLVVFVLLLSCGGGGGLANGDSNWTGANQKELAKHKDTLSKNSTPVFSSVSTKFFNVRNGPPVRLLGTRSIVASLEPTSALLPLIAWRWSAGPRSTLHVGQWVLRTQFRSPMGAIWNPLFFCWPRFGNVNK